MFVLMAEHCTTAETRNKKAGTIALTGPTRDLTKQTVQALTVDATEANAASSLMAMVNVHTLLDCALPTIMDGEFNAKHTAWNLNSICLYRRRLLDDSMLRGYQVLGPETPTHFFMSATTSRISSTWR